MVEIFNDIYTIPERAKGCVLAIGNFDGVHIGHRHLLGEAKRTAKKTGDKLAVMTFNPHPIEFFWKDSKSFKLSSSQTKHKLLEDLEVDFIFNISFDAEFIKITADDFIFNILRDSLNIKHLVVGDDFSFGYKRTGNIATLEKLSLSNRGFDYTPVGKVILNKEIISSSLIRNFIKSGNFKNAKEYLGRYWNIEATIVEKTNNSFFIGVSNEEYIKTPSGVYACKIIDQESNAVIDAIIIRDNNHKNKNSIYKIYMIDYDINMYNRNIKLIPIEYIREEHNFEEVSNLEKDIIKAKNILSNIENNWLRGI